MDRWDELKKYLTDYETQKKKESGEYGNSRYCIAISITDILEKMNEIDNKFYKRNLGETKVGTE